MTLSSEDDEFIHKKYDLPKLQQPPILIEENNSLRSLDTNSRGRSRDSSQMSSQSKRS